MTYIAYRIIGITKCSKCNGAGAIEPIRRGPVEICQDCNGMKVIEFDSTLIDAIRQLYVQGSITDGLITMWQERFKKENLELKNMDISTGGHWSTNIKLTNE